MMHLHFSCSTHCIAVSYYPSLPHSPPHSLSEPFLPLPHTSSFPLPSAPSSLLSSSTPSFCPFLPSLPLSSPTTFVRMVRFIISIAMTVAAIALTATSIKLLCNDTTSDVTQALDLHRDSSNEVEKDGEREERLELLVYKEVTARIRSGRAVDTFALFALFR